MFSDFSIDHVFAFDHEDDFCVVIYAASMRDFMLFTARSYLQQTHALPSLLNELQDQSGENTPAVLLDKAAKLVEDKMHSQGNSRFYFDAH